MMIRNKLTLALLLAACGGASIAALPHQDAAPPPEQAFSESVVVRARTVLDGLGGTMTDRDIVVQDGVIAAIVARGDGRGSTVYELDGLTVLPGLIDTHVHLGWHFDRTGRTASREVEETAEEAVLFAAENGWVTLRGGVTTVQSIGAPVDAEVRDAIDRGVLPGPRVLTSLGSIGAGVGDGDALRATVRDLHEAGADVVKLFASASIRVGGTPTMTQEQLDAACGEASRLGLRTVVHAHGPESARRAAIAGCTTIEHGALLDRATLEVMAQHGMFYDPNIDLVFRNYFENKDRFIGVGNYTEEGFEQMRQAVPAALAAFQEALTVPGLRVVYGTDAVAGAHGRNVQELVYRVGVGGQSAMDAIVSATSLAAASLGMDDTIGTIAAGMAADIIATEGDPSRDIAALERVRFVMRAGTVVRHDPPANP